MIRFGDVVISRSTLTIRNGKRSYRWHGTKRRCEFRIMEAMLLSGGMTKKQIFDVVYGDDADGGPMVGYSIVSIKLASRSMKDKLRRLNMEVRTHWHNSYVVHRLVALSA